MIVCEAPRIEMPADVGERWLAALGRACDDLVAMDDRDASAYVIVRPSGTELVVEVVLADGRSATRRVPTPFALRGTLEVLLTLPPDARRVLPPPITTPTPAEVPPETPAPPPLTKSEPSIGMEISFDLAGRIAGGEYRSVAPTLAASLVVQRWLFGLCARWDLAQTADVASPAVFEMDTVGAGIAVARRLDVRIGYLDVGFSPRLLAESQSFEASGKEISRSASDVRLASFARLAFGHGAFRFAVGLDGELSPARVRREIRLDAVLPPLPAWSAGLSAGLSWTAQ